MPIKIFVISNFRMVHHAIQIGLLQSDRFKLVGSAEEYQSGLQALAANPADVVLLDIDNDPDSVAPLVSTIHAVSKAKILLLTRLKNTALQDQAVILGARGVVDHTADISTILSALEKVNEGQVWLDRAATGRIFVELSRIGNNSAKTSQTPKPPVLTDREQEIVSFIARNTGDPGKTISRKLNISESTLRNHLTSIYEKLGVANRHGLLAYAFQNGLAETRTAQ